MKHFATSALAVALALASGTAAALGLGQIEVKSKAGQPLVAEIPIISSDPAELEALQVGPASPETFARIGLTPPQGMVADLQFMVALDSAGNPVIRVTSQQPVTQPLLTFLVEVDSIQGRLVREYSALIDTPQTVAAPLQPPVAAPVVSAPNVIERPAVAAEPLADVAEDAPDETAAPSEEAPAADPVAAAEAPAPEPVAAVPEPSFSPSPATDALNVERGDTLSGLAGQLDMPGMSLDQAMIALLRANPDAFIGGNINQLKQGAVLRVPPAGELAAVDAGEASALVRAQVRQWRQARAPAPQPVASGDGVVERDPSPAAAAAAPRAASARLEIVPPGASQANRAGNQSGMSAGGEGEMLRQEMQVTKETLAARDAEVQELKTRIAELEKLQQDQQQLLSMKDTELAAAQQRLAASNAAAPSQPAPDGAASASLLPWILGGSGVLLVALLGGWLMRRRAADAPRFRPPMEPVSPLAAAFPPAASPRDDLFGNPPEADVADAETDATPAPAPASVIAPPLHAKAAPSFATTAPVKPAAPVVDPADGLWDRRERAQLHGGRTAEAVQDDANAVVVPAWHAGAAASAPVAGGGEQLELARAYLDLGDRDGARQLLSEVLLHGDLEARQRASRMLRDLE
ncbi:FimV/HubP family polar landmark protein [Cognatilysobacter tabacisoli]|uniref:FimV/HubP family polar landmark protein n=1 Tax=Cognatilysobacter tabacisoli TaxID=2315424 RepID=UPI001E652B85|nr:FimV/HubP family polar landmark protein [Lysobacter tabacisoli]